MPESSKAGFGVVNGLDLDNPMVVTPEERANFTMGMLAGRAGKFMYPLSAYSYMLENRPDVLKHHYRLTSTLGTDPNEMLGGAVILTLLHHYIVLRFEEGIIHEVKSSQLLGATKAQVNELFALSFVQGGCCAFRGIYEETMDYMAQYREPATPIAWPAGWAPDPAAYASGLDFSAREMLDGELDKLFAWYEATIGYVPRSAALMAKCNPTFLKAYRAKLENAVSTGTLPKQLFPYISIHYNVHRGFREGIREATLLGKAWGMTRSQVVSAVVLGTAFMGSLDSAYITDEAIGDILEAWD